MAMQIASRPTRYSPGGPLDGSSRETGRTTTWSVFSARSLRISDILSLATNILRHVEGLRSKSFLVYDSANMNPVPTLARMLSLGVLIAPVFAQYKVANPQVSKIVSEISEERITETLKKMESFGTRNLMSSQDDPARGIGAARKWIYAQLSGYSPRLEVAYDQHRVKKIEGRASRIPRDVDLYNIVAVLPGTTSKEQRIMISSHY